MKIFEVTWKVPNQNTSLMISSAIYDPSRYKSFASKEKADEFYSKLIAAAQLIGISVDVRIIEKEIE